MGQFIGRSICLNILIQLERLFTVSLIDRLDGRVKGQIPARCAADGQRRRHLLAADTANAGFLIHSVGMGLHSHIVKFWNSAVRYGVTALIVVSCAVRQQAAEHAGIGCAQLSEAASGKPSCAATI